MVSTRSSSFRKKARRVLSLIYTPRKLLSSNFFPFAFLILDEPSRIHIQNEKVGGRNQFSISNVFYGSLISKHWFNLKEGSGCCCCWLSLNWNSEMSLFCFFKRCYDVQPMKSYLHFWKWNSSGSICLLKIMKLVLEKQSFYLVFTRPKSKFSNLRLRLRPLSSTRQRQLA